MSRVYWKFLLLLCLSLLAACGAAVTQYYVLNTIAASKPVVESHGLNQGQSGELQSLQSGKSAMPPPKIQLARIQPAKIQPFKIQQIAIRQLEIPRYLDRPRMVSRDAKNHLRISEIHQWGGRLRDDLARTLSDDLADRLASVAVFTAPFPGSMHADISFLIDIRQFELLADGYMHLKVRWHIQRAGKETLSYFNQMVSEGVIDRADYAAMAAAMSELLAQLSDKMAMAVVNLSTPPMPVIDR